jgi:hypothetical protein
MMNGAAHAVFKWGDRISQLPDGFIAAQGPVLHQAINK